MQATLNAIHNQALKILETVGIELFQAEILGRLRNDGVSVDGCRAFFPPQLVMEAIGQAPEAFTLQARNRSHDTKIGGSEVNCAPGYGCAAVCAPDGSRRDARMDDYVRFAKLVHQCPHLVINGGILAQPSDVPADKSHLLMIYAAMLSSDKCLMGVPGHTAQMQAIMDLAAFTCGGQTAFRAKPRILTLVNTTSPLRMDAMTLDSMLVAARHNQPLIISPSPAAGSTGPIDLAANVALATAEALAAITIVQLVNPGNPVIFGLQCLGADLRSGNIAVGSPAYARQLKITAALARRYRLPSRCGGAPTDAPALSAQSGYESMLNLLASFEHGVNLIVHSAGTLGAFSAISYEKFIMDIEMIAMVKYYRSDLDVDGDVLDLGLIQDVGPGGLFLNQMDTVRKCRSHAWDSAVNLGGTRAPEAAYLDRITARQQAMLDAYVPPAMDPALRKDVDDFMVRKGVDMPRLEQIGQLIGRST